jgi:endonuclease G
LLQEGDELIIHTGFSLLYDEAHEQPRWVAYHLTRDEVYGIHERADDFRIDPKISTGSATLEDYRGSGYDRGHLIPAADLGWSEQSMSDSFYLSNMSPQDPSFNRGIWASLEAVVRTYAATEGSVYVATGPILTDGPYQTIGENRVSVPKQYYKVILDYTEPEKKASWFLLPNEGTRARLERFATSVDHIEQVSGIDFFPQLPDDEEQLLEGSFDFSLWPNDEFSVSMADRQAYAADKSTFIPKPDEPFSLRMVRAFLDRIMVMTKREVNSVLRLVNISL